jgi:hypothetical protein
MKNHMKHTNEDRPNLMCRIASRNGSKMALHKKMLKTAIALVACVIGTLAQVSDGQAQSTKLVAAFYYDSHDNLLQIEDLTTVSLIGRALSDLDHNKVPVINRAPAPALTCTTTQKMLPAAKYAVYYGFQPPPGGSSIDARAKPLKVENLTGEFPRVLNCHPGPPAACTWPPHWCSCGTALACPPGCCM